MPNGRVMVAFGYHGDCFHGSQIQPDIRTVEGSLKKALKKLRYLLGVLVVCVKTEILSCFGEELKKLERFYERFSIEAPLIHTIELI